MAKPKFDGVVEAVHYKPDGQIDWVRAYLRRGAAFSDRILINRQALIEQVKAGKHFLSGKRIPLMAGTFEVSRPVKVIQSNGSEILVTDELQTAQDCLEGVPVI
jgi:hypothetical protein